MLGTDPRFCCLFLFLAILPLLGEYLLSLPALSQWNSFPPQNADEVRLLLVADPHVHCYTPLLGLFNYLIQADTDWFLYSYFRLAVRHFKPGVVVVLGDLTEQGSTSSPESLSDCFSRFRSSFISWHTIPVFVVPGDNDIGGQFEDLLTFEKYARFEQVFGNYSQPRTVGFVHLYADLPQFADRLPTESWAAPIDKKHLSVVAAHYPFVTPYGAEIPKHLLRIEPSLLLFGHDHVAYVLTWQRPLSQQRKEVIRWVVPPSSRRLPRLPVTLQLGDRLSESSQGVISGGAVGLGVPACTYRSGLPHLAAYGLLQVFPNRSLTYTLLPLPNRWLTLSVYSFAVSLLFGCGVLTHFKKTVSLRCRLKSTILLGVLLLLSTGISLRSLSYIVNTCVGNTL